MTKQVTLSLELQSLLPQMTLGVISLTGGIVGPTPEQLIKEGSDLAADLRTRYDRSSMLAIPGVKECRDAFRTLRIDPTRYRPSSEALIKRILQGEALPSVNMAVDLGNLWSVRLASPLGLLNSSEIRGNVVCRLGHEGESYEGLNGRLMNMVDKPVLVDDLGPFGSPIVDSVRTQVTCGTTEMMLVVFLFTDDRDRRQGVLRKMAQSFEEYGFKSSVTK
ncbi:MAG: B3/4 domain-containing protein [Bacillota bacterium]